MLTSLSSNVVLAKARTMYGRRLTQADYNELLKCRSVGEVAGYLKNHTVYSKALAGVVENEIHRGQLESRLKQKVMDEYASLSKYEVEVDDHFSQSFIQRDEIEYLLQAVRLLNANSPGSESEHAFYFPPYLLHTSKLNLQALSRVKTVDDLKAVLRGTPYEKLIDPFLSVTEQRIDYTALENALYHYFYTNIIQIIKKHFHGETKEQLLSIYNAYLDLNNYVRIVRMKVKYGADAEAAKKALLPTGSFSDDVVDRMLQGTTEEEIQKALEHTELGRRALKTRHAYLDEIPARMNYELCRHDMDYSTNPPVVLISYIFLIEAEMNNIITIIEGKRYQLAAEEIRKLLIFEGFNLIGNSGASTQGRE